MFAHTKSHLINFKTEGLIIMTINKKEFAALVAEYLKTTKQDAEKYTDAALQVITDCLARGDKIKLIGFGEFGVVQTSARNGVNPQTKKPIQIPAKLKPYFKAGKTLKEAI